MERERSRSARFLSISERTIGADTPFSSIEITAMANLRINSGGRVAPISGLELLGETDSDLSTDPPEEKPAIRARIT